MGYPGQTVGGSVTLAVTSAEALRKQSRKCFVDGESPSLQDQTTGSEIGSVSHVQLVVERTRQIQPSSTLMTRAMPNETNDIYRTFLIKL